MLAATYPIQILLMTFSGLVNRHEADIIAYLVEETAVVFAERASLFSCDQFAQLIVIKDG